MSEQPNISDDGKWRWTGTEWVPNVAGTAPPPLPPTTTVRPRSRAGWWILGCVVCLIAGTVCGAGIASSSASPKTASSGTTPAPGPTVTVTVNVTPPPKPSPYSVDGVNSKVTDTFNLEKGSYRVSWKASGSSNFIAHVRDSATGTTLANEILPNPSAGEIFYNSPGGTTILDVEASSASWTITFQKL